MHIIISIVLLILVLGVIIFVHELGHFAVAKWFGIRVDEFGMGFPPRAAKLFSYKGTDYTINWIPFGGFVKIYGEDSLDKNDPDYARSLMAKKWWQQIAVLIAGVSMNVLLAWFIFSGMAMAGKSVPVAQSKNPELVTNTVLTIMGVADQSPAQRAGITAGDVITKITTSTSIIANPDVAVFTKTIQDLSEDASVTLSVKRLEGVYDITVSPSSGIVAGKKAIGVAVDLVGDQPGLPFFASFIEGAKTTGYVISQTAQSFGQLITGKVSLDAVSGPVGLTKIVGQATQIGFSSLLILIAVISINLSIINILPFPALDGGRILFVLIETVIRRPLPKKFVEWTNGIGFGLLILLMIVVTVKDIFKLF